MGWAGRKKKSGVMKGPHCLKLSERKKILFQKLSWQILLLSKSRQKCDLDTKAWFANSIWTWNILRIWAHWLKGQSPKCLLALSDNRKHETNPQLSYLALRYEFFIQDFLIKSQTTAQGEQLRNVIKDIKIFAVISWRVLHAYHYMFYIY